MCSGCGNCEACVIVRVGCEYAETVRGMRGVGGVCEMCMCFARGGMGMRGEYIRGCGLGFTNPMGTGGMLYVCLCSGCCDVDGVGGFHLGQLIGLYHHIAYI